MAIDISNLDSGADKPKDARAALLALAQDHNTLRNTAPAPLSSVAGTANAITASTSQIDSLTTGARVLLIPAADNTGATTLQLDGGGVISIIWPGGAPLSAGALRAGRPVELAFTGSAWKILADGTHEERATALENAGPWKLSSVGGTANAITATATAIKTVSDGTRVLLQPSADNTGAVTLAVNGGGAYGVQDGYGGALAAGGLKSGRYYELMFIAAGGVWKIVTYGHHQEWIRALRNSSASLLTSVAGTNTITATSSTIDSVSSGTRVLFAPAADNTGAATLNVNGLGAFNVYDGYGGPVGAGALKAGRYYEAIFFGAGNVWQIIGYGDEHEKVRALRNSSPSLLTSVAGTNTITASSSVIDSVTNGTRVLLIPASDNTGSATLNVNSLGTYAVQDGYGGAIVAGTLKAGRYYELIFSTPGNVWKILSYGDDRAYLRSLFAGIPTVGGTANAITLATDNYPQKGMLLYFVPAATNTGAVTLNVTAPSGSSGALSLLKAGNAPLVAGDLIANLPVLAIYEGAPGNNWKLVTAAGTASSTSQLDTNLASMLALVTTTPYGSQSYAAGAVTQVDNAFPLVGTGSSVGRGEGARHPSDPAGNADWAPVTRLAAILAEELGLVGKFTFTVDNESVNGSFDNELPTQFAARGAGFTSGRIHLITPGMNSATVFGVMSAATLPGQIAGLRSACLASIAAGYVPIPYTTPHPHPLWAWQAAGGAGGGLLTSWGWPTPTLNLTVPFTVNATARTISGSFLTTYDPFGGTKLSVGSVLRFGSGPNSGVDLVIAGFPAADTVTIAAGPTLTSETAVSRQIVHVVSAAENETLMPLPPSKRYVRGNRSGAGETMGLRLYDLYNAALVALTRELRIPVILADQMSFDFVVANGGDTLVWNESTKTMTGSAPGWDAGYTTSYPGFSDVQQFNHQNIAHRTATFDLGARKLARLIRRGELTRDTVIR